MDLFYGFINLLHNHKYNVLTVLTIVSEVPTGAVAIIVFVVAGIVWACYACAIIEANICEARWFWKCKLMKLKKKRYRQVKYHCFCTFLWFLDIRIISNTWQKKNFVLKNSTKNVIWYFNFGRKIASMTSPLFDILLVKIGCFST